MNRPIGYEHSQGKTAEALADLEVADLTAQSIDPDFNRKPVPHRLYRIRHRLARVTETS